MNTRLVATIVCLAITGSAAAQGREDLPSISQPSVGSALEGFNEKYSSYVPQVGDQEFEMFRLESESTVELPCSGIPQYGAVTNVGGEISRVFSYLQNNALGLAVNYLVYRNPTLYSLLQNMNQKHSFLTQQMMSSCGDVREMANDNREQFGSRMKEFEMAAIQDCLNDGKTAEHCSLGGNLAAGTRNAQRDRQRTRDQMAGTSGATPTDLVMGRMQASTLSKSNITGETFETTIRDITGDEVLGAGSGSVAGPGGGGGFGSGGGSGSRGASQNAGPDVSGTSGRGEPGVSIDPPDAQIEDKVIEMSQEFQSKYNSIVASADNQSLDTNQAYNELMQLPGIPTLSGTQVLDLNRIKERFPGRYRQILGALSRESAVKSMSYILDKYEVALLDAKTTTSGAVTEDEWARRFDELRYLRAQLELIENRAKYEEDILSIVEAARRSSDK